MNSLWKVVIIPANLPGRCQEFFPIRTNNMLLLYLNRYHPFYITDSPEGGIGQKTGLELTKQKAYAGVEYDEDGSPIPTAGKF